MYLHEYIEEAFSSGIGMSTLRKHFFMYLHEYIEKVFFQVFLQVPSQSLSSYCSLTDVFPDSLQTKSFILQIELPKR